MTTNTNKVCRDCGKPLTPDTLLGLCPECMMKAGLASSAKATIAVAPDAFVEGPETETKEFVLGTKLGYIGDYELLEEIARGGMGVVYKARQSSLKRIVAVKTIRSGELAGETEVQRFRTEAQAAAQLQHPNIVAIHEIGEHEGKHYFSMDFVEGKNLAQIVDGKPVAPNLAAEWLKAIAEAVQYAHQRGVLHRDLKPQNIMLDTEGRPRVTDFGLAKNLAGDSTLTQTGAIMGSPSYMSPEQARGRNDLVGPASDVYSLGAMLYELLTGRPPFRGKSPMETVSQVVNDEPPRPRSLNGNASVDLETICLKCMEKEPLRRYPTARELEADLGRFLAGEPVQARPVSAMRRTMSWFRRHPWMLSAALSVAILTLKFIAYGLWEQTRYLTWLNIHPDYVRAPGPRKVALDAVGHYVITFMLVVVPILAVFFRKFTTGATWNKIFEPPMRPPSLGVALAFGAFAASGCVVAILLAAKAIQVFVWEGVFMTGFLLGCVLPLFYFFFAALMEVVRQQRRIVLEPRPENKAAPLPPEQLTPIHEAIFAGRINDAFNLYHAGKGEQPNRKIADYKDLLQMEAELKRPHPEKFSAAALNRPIVRPVFWNWLFLVSSMLLGLIILLNHSPWLFFWLLDGMVAGAFIRWMSSNNMSGWKRAYRGMRPPIKWAAWFLVACFVFGIIGWAWFIVGLIAHPNSQPDPRMGLFVCGAVAGWLGVHLWLRKRKAAL